MPDRPGLGCRTRTTGIVRVVAAHLTAGVKSDDAGTHKHQDHYGNVWEIVPQTGELTVTPAQSIQPQAVRSADCIDDWTAVAADDHGFIWLAALGPRLYFCNPRQIVDTETPDGSEQLSKEDPTALHPVNSMLLPSECGEVVSMARSAASGAVVATFASGTMLELDVVGNDIGGPFTSGHASDAAIVRNTLTPATSKWKIHQARLPCGNHDIFASEAGGKLFITGGVTHYRGFPAVSHAFSELLAFDGDSWRVHAQMSEGSCYSAVVGLPELPHPEIWVIGGGGPTLPGPLATTQIFDASSGKRREGVPLPGGRLGCVGAAVGGRVYVVGGSGGFGGHGFDECLSIAPGESDWRFETPAPGGPLPAATLAGCALDGKIYVLGGVEPARFMSFDPESGSWDTGLPPHPIGSQAAYMAAHNGEIWVACGGVIIGPSNPDNKGEARKYNVRDQCPQSCQAVRRFSDRFGMVYVAGGA